MHRMLNAPWMLNAPLRLSPIADPDGLVGSSARQAVETLVRQHMHAKRSGELGIVVRRRVRQGAPSLASFAREVVDRWGVGGSRRANDGVLYVLATQQRSHHLFCGAGIKWALGAAERAAILKSVKPLLQANKTDAAIVAMARAVFLRIERQETFWWRIKTFGVALTAVCAILALRWFLLRRRRREREAAYRALQERLRQARQRFECMGAHEQLSSACCVCIEPLRPPEPSAPPLDQNFSSGSSQLGPTSAEAVSPPTDSLTDTSWHLRRDSIGGAVSHDGEVELLRCGHIMHTSCVSQALRVLNACPLCRMPDPRLGGAFATGAALAIAQEASLRHLRNQELYWQTFLSSADHFYEDIVAHNDERASSRRVTRSYRNGNGTARLTAHRSNCESKRELVVATDDDYDETWGHGNSHEGDGTTDTF